MEKWDYSTPSFPIQSRGVFRGGGIRPHLCQFLPPPLKLPNYFFNIVFQCSPLFEIPQVHPPLTFLHTALQSLTLAIRLFFPTGGRQECVDAELEAERGDVTGLHSSPLGLAQLIAAAVHHQSWVQLHLVEQRLCQGEERRREEERAGGKDGGQEGGIKRREEEEGVIFAQYF